MQSDRKVDPGQALEHYAAALPLARQAGDAWLIAVSLSGLTWTTPDPSEALAYLEEFQVVALRLDAARLTPEIEHYLGHRARLAGNLAEASCHLQASLAGYYAVGNNDMASVVLWRLSRVAVAQGDNAAARDYLEQGLAIDPAQRSPQHYAELLLERSALAARQGEAAALPMLRECLTALYKADDLKWVSQAVAVAAEVALRCGDGVRAARLLGAADGLWQSLPMHIYYKMDYHSECERLLPLVRAALPSAEFEAAWATGERMTLEQAVAYALEASEADELPVR
jgi:non-specific serine/threonine protein kinase